MSMDLVKRRYRLNSSRNARSLTPTRALVKARARFTGFGMTTLHYSRLNHYQRPAIGAKRANRPMTKSRNPINRTLARMDFPSKAHARYKKCREGGNNYIRQAVLRRRNGVASLRQGSANPAVLDSGIAERVWLQTCGRSRRLSSDIGIRRSRRRMAGCALPI